MADVSKWQKALLKKLRLAASLASRLEAGEDLDAAQQSKASKVDELAATAASAGASQEDISRARSVGSMRQTLKGHATKRPGANASSQAKRRSESVRALQSVCRHRPLDAEAADHAASEVAHEAASLHANDAAAALQAFAKLRVAAPAEEAVVASLAQHCGELDSCGAANALWALARLKRTADTKLLQRLQSRVGDLAPQCNSQDVANVLWAFAKLQWSPSSEVWTAMATRSMQLADEFKAQELSIVLWSMATLGVAPAVMVADALQHAALWWANSGEYMEAQAIANMLWALGRLACWIEPCMVVSSELSNALASRAAQSAQEFTNQGIANSLWGCAHLRVSVELVEPLVNAVRPSSLSSTDVGEIAWSLGRLQVLNDVLVQALVSRAAELAQDALLHWQALGRIDYLLHTARASGKKLRVAKACRALAEASVEVAEKLNAGRGELQIGAHNLLVDSCRATLFSMPPGSHVLVVDDFQRLIGKMLRTAEIQVTSWQRFSVGRRSGEPWPKQPHASYDAAVVRLPPTKAAFEMSLSAVVAVLASRSPIWIYGARVEGSHTLLPLLRSSDLLSNIELVAENAGYTVIRGTVQPQKSVACLNDYMIEGKLVGKDFSMPWRAFPGLFAGGFMDVMTSALLASLPAPPPAGRILDFCCGSGSICAALLWRDATLRVHGLDADAVALEAAKLNVLGVKRWHLSDCWNSLPCSEGGGPRYHWIVSNPPVHCGLQPDFTVLCSLLEGAPKRLRPSGCLWLVCQTYIPVGCLCPSARVHWSDGRFIVWRVDSEDSKESSERPGQGV